MPENCLKPKRLKECKIKITILNLVTFEPEFRILEKPVRF